MVGLQAAPSAARVDTQPSAAGPRVGHAEALNVSRREARHGVRDSLDQHLAVQRVAVERGRVDAAEQLCYNKSVRRVIEKR